MQLLSAMAPFFRKKRCLTCHPTIVNGCSPPERQHGDQPFVIAAVEVVVIGLANDF